MEYPCTFRQNGSFILRKIKRHRYQTLSYEDGSSFNAIVKGDIKVRVLFDTAAEITIQYEANEVI